VIFAAITLSVASQRVIPKVRVYFFNDSVRKISDTPSYILSVFDRTCWCRGKLQTYICEVCRSDLARVIGYLVIVCKQPLKRYCPCMKLLLTYHPLTSHFIRRYINYEQETVIKSRTVIWMGARSTNATYEQCIQEFE
jgi:hypothetical protein